MRSRPGTAFLPLGRKATIRAVFAPGAALPRLSPSHLTLMHRLRVMWLRVESGAPAIDSFQPLLGQGAAVTQAMTALHTADEELAVRTLAELGRLVVSFVQKDGDLAPGRYAVPAEMRETFAFPDSGVDAEGWFELSKEHLALLKAAWWREVDSDSIDDVFDSEQDDEQQAWPMPYIDGKRPYGNYTYYEIEMAEILGEPYQFDQNRKLIKDAEKDIRLTRLHKQTLVALQVFLIYATAQT